MKIWYHRKSSQYKNTSDAIAAQSGEVYPGHGEDVYEDPDRTTTTPREFKLTECPAYVTTTASSPQPNTEAQLQSGYYELWMTSVIIFNKCVAYSVLVVCFYFLFVTK